MAFGQYRRYRLKPNKGALSPMEMHQIRYFLAVCDSLNFTRAAEACNVTQPALTRAIQKLEEELGSMLLLHRERSRTHLTDFGQLMRPHLEQIVSNAEQAATTAKSFLRLEEAPLRLGVMCTVGPTRCIGLLAQFNKEHPGVDVTLSEGVPERVDGIAAGGRSRHRPHGQARRAMIGCASNRSIASASWLRFRPAIALRA